MADPKTRYGSNIVYGLNLSKSDLAFSNQFLQFSIKGHLQLVHHPGCFLKPSTTPVWVLERGTQHGSFIGKLKQTEISLLNRLKGAFQEE